MTRFVSRFSRQSTVSRDSKSGTDARFPSEVRKVDGVFGNVVLSLDQQSPGSIPGGATTGEPTGNRLARLFVFRRRFVSARPRTPRGSPAGPWIQECTPVRSARRNYLMRSRRGAYTRLRKPVRRGRNCASARRSADTIQPLSPIVLRPSPDLLIYVARMLHSARPLQSRRRCPQRSRCTSILPARR